MSTTTTVDQDAISGGKSLSWIPQMPTSLSFARKWDQRIFVSSSLATVIVFSILILTQPPLDQADKNCVVFSAQPLSFSQVPFISESLPVHLLVAHDIEVPKVTADGEESSEVPSVSHLCVGVLYTWTALDIRNAINFLNLGTIHILFALASLFLTTNTLIHLTFPEVLLPTLTYLPLYYVVCTIVFGRLGVGSQMQFLVGSQGLLLGVQRATHVSVSGAISVVDFLLGASIGVGRWYWGQAYVVDRLVTSVSNTLNSTSTL
ncbi:hypothetical protein M427DRAFT_160862 [Gonapodya prolifera JEL478]|uniref:Uncharacterized protein n=1 Tax=Gonapodya prolifera (strain JEL478) TaxID=1344416 RepID=A0A138ZXL9_GONPJ|nr:hypothetical protein M427DRAFT_160862 [Gonapodya prolifera JEL478]|eukprot:KXS09250.1 hypothetical protein M427DRAFT_160862 [Gonapodya prolifera JEL478]